MIIKALCVKSLNSCLALFCGLTLLVCSPSAQAKTICTMTFNSDDEKKVLQDIYERQNVHFVELVPETRHDQWLDKACRSGIQCDVLLISGHFGGVFFGETSGLSLSLPEMEQASCRSECDGIFKRPQDVLLYGCNTLAGKKRDHRSFEEYVQVLVRDGFDRELAETVALSRYTEMGLTMAERFSSTFANTARIHGYTSTGPLGKNAAPHIRKALKDVSAQSLFQLGFPVEKMIKTLGSASYGVTSGENLKSERSLQSPLICAPSSLKEETFTILFSKPYFRKYYDSILRQVTSSEFVNNLKKWIKSNPDREATVRKAFTELNQRQETTLRTRLRIADFLHALGFLSDEGLKITKDATLRKALQDFSRNDFTYQEAEQLCGLRSHFQSFQIDPDWISPDADGSPYLPTISKCLNPRLKIESETIATLPTAFDICLHQARSKATPAQRDGTRWSCYNSYSYSLTSLAQCQGVAGQYETDSRNGLDWLCMREFSQELTVEQCLIAAKRNSDISNADDMLWSCWSRLQHREYFTRSQCLNLSVNMNIHGNRLKMNWNCQNRL